MGEEYTAMYFGQGESASCLEVYHTLLSSKKMCMMIDPCDCPCGDLVEVKTPPRSVVALSYVAQALVVTIVGLNMGFRWCVRVSYMRGVGEVGKELQVPTSVNKDCKKFYPIGKTSFKFGRNCSW
jgi:hypothetical protein